MMAGWRLNTNHESPPFLVSNGFAHMLNRTFNIMYVFNQAVLKYRECSPILNLDADFDFS